MAPSILIVSMVITCLSLLGSTGIIIGYFASDGRRLRQKLVLGLGTTDAIGAITVIVGTSYSLTGRKFSTDSPGCDVSGFIYQACVVTSAAWTLLIASTTYVALVHPHSWLASKLEHRHAFIYISAFAWTLGLIPAAAGTALFEQVDAEGICWYTPGTIQSKLMLFVPRAVTLFTVIALYIRLFVFFSNRDVSALDSTTDSSHDEEVDRSSKRHSIARFSHAVINWSRRPSDPESAEFNDKENYLSHHPSAFAGDESPDLLLAQAQEEQSHLPSPTTSPQVANTNHPSPPLPAAVPRLGPKRNSILVNSHRANEIYANGNANGSPDTQDDGRTLTDLRLSYHTPVQIPSPKKMSFQVHRLHHNSPQATAASEGYGGSTRQLSPRHLNRRLALLMLMYPLAYLLLFSVAVGRLAQELHTNKPSSSTLQSVSRYLVFGQGFVDGCIYLFIEWAFRKANAGRT